MRAILCFGDSITHGRGVEPNFGWVHYLKKFYEKKSHRHVVYNLGIPGDTSDDVLYRFKTEAASRVKYPYPGAEFLILLSIGMNDARWHGLPSDKKPEVSKRRFKGNVSKLIKQAKKFKAGLAVIGITPVDESKTLPFEDKSCQNDRIAEFNDVLQEVCNKNDVPFLDILSLMVNQDYEKMIGDGVHPNAKGYKFIFDKVKEFLVSHELIE